MSTLCPFAALKSHPTKDLGPIKVKIANNKSILPNNLFSIRQFQQLFCQFISPEAVQLLHPAQCLPYKSPLNQDLGQSR